MKLSLLNVFFLAAVIFLISGCQVGQFSEIGAQSHFNYPNSNVKALGPVKVTVDGSSGLGLTLRTGEGDEKLYNKALAQVEGANLLIDYVKTTKMYTLPIIPVFWSTIELEGTAAKMELGQQVLK